MTKRGNEEVRDEGGLVEADTLLDFKRSFEAAFVESMEALVGLGTI